MIARPTLMHGDTAAHTIEPRVACLHPCHDFTTQLAVAQRDALCGIFQTNAATQRRNSTGASKQPNFPVVIYRTSSREKSDKK